MPDDPGLVARSAEAVRSLARTAGRVPRPAQVAAVLVLHAGLAWNAAVRDAATFDESLHLSGGYTYLDRGDFRLSPEAPPLARMWAALPLWLSGLEDVDYSSESWRESRHWPYGFEFMFGPMHRAECRRPLERLLPGRLMVILLGILMGLVVYAWSREMWGHPGAVVSLVLYAVSPVILAHTHLVTVDAATGLGFALCGWLFWRWCRSPSLARAAPAGVALGIALLVKMSSVVLVLILPALALLWMARRARWAGWRGLAPRALGGLALMGAIAYTMLWAGYGFRFRTSPDPAYSVSVRSLDIREPALLRPALCFIERHRLLPESYIYGFGTLYRPHEHFSYLNGRVTLEKSWSLWYFFPEVILLKSTPAELAVMIWLAIASWRRRRKRSSSWWYLAQAIVLFLACAVVSRVYMGQRHLLPMYVFVFVAAGALVRLQARKAPGLLLVAGVLLSQMVSSFGACPRYLAYFNPIGGPPERASRWLVDSNLDWGQDLSRLPAEMARLGIGEVYLVYNGTSDPRAYGVRYRKAGEWSKEIRKPEPTESPPPGSYVAISIHTLRCSDQRLALQCSRLDPVGKAGDTLLIYRMP
jgi:hypothetical protein